jgi:hypothetical protein
MTNLKKGFGSPFPTPSLLNDRHGPATVLVLDRSIDLISPLIHSLSYESATHDYFEIEESYENEICNLM